VVGDDVVELTGYPGALLQQRALRTLGLADRLLLDEQALGLAPLPYRGPDHQHQRAEDEQQECSAAAARRYEEVQQLVCPTASAPATPPDTP
jgi:hypothetical protein